MAATTLAGQHLGAERPERVFETLRVSVYFGLALALATAAQLLIFPQEIGSLFLKASAEKGRVLVLLRDYYRWMAFIFPCFAITFAIQGVLRSAGDTMALLALSFLSMFVARIPLAYLLAGPLGFRQDGIWMAILFSGLLAVVVNWLYFAYGPWRRRRLLVRRP
jgi:Na+-driven multidrug efflux pump